MAKLMAQQKPSPEEWDAPGTKYNCFDCHAPCCSLYENVLLTEADCEDLAAYFDLNMPDFLRRYTRLEDGERFLRRKPDRLLGGTTCILLNSKTRLCGAHQARPECCRIWPPKHTRGHCPYYDVITFERRHQSSNVLLHIKISVLNS